jgi:SMC interacting uncharacterized protein involved in chromosome segregation
MGWNLSGIFVNNGFVLLRGVLSLIPLGTLAATIPYITYPAMLVGVKVMAGIAVASAAIDTATSVITVRSYHAVKKQLEVISAETTRLQDQNNLYESHNKELQAKLTDLTATADKISGENTKLSAANSRLEKTRGELEEVREKYAGENARLEKTRAGLAADLVAAGEAVHALKAQVSLLLAYNDRMKINVKDMENQVATMRGENRELKDNISAFAAESARLREYAGCQEELLLQSKKFIAALITTDKSLDEIREKLGQSVDKFGGLVGVLTRITAEITTGKFAEMDINNDGVISREEFEQWVSKMKK